jgi:geranylgeranylglycerol-phosphate geranylgeranyltransferase
MAVAAILLSGAYSWWLKETLLLGNIAVGVLVASALLFGGLAARNLTPALIAAAAMALVFVIAQEVLFNLEDEAGDRAAGVRTTATRLGPTRTLTMHRTFALGTIGVSLAPVALGMASRSYLYCVVSCIMLPTFVLLRMLAGTPNAATLERAGWLTRFIWVSGIVPTLLLRQ